MTLISHTYRYVFVHIPKNGGTSVAQALEPLTRYRDQEIGGTELGQVVAPYYRRRFGIGKHSTLREILDRSGDGDLANYHSFCVTRDPISRLESTFAFLGRWTEWRELPGYQEFAREFSSLRTLDDFIGSGMFATSGPDRLFVPQVEWIVDSHGSFAVDSTLRLESIESALPELMLRIGVPPGIVSDVRVPRVNATRHTHTATALSAASLDLIRRRYAEDFARLGYEPPG